MENQCEYIDYYIKSISGLIKSDTSSIIEIFGVESQGKTTLSKILYLLLHNKGLPKNLLVINPLNDEYVINGCDPYVIINAETCISMLNQMFVYYKNIIIDDYFAIIENGLSSFIHRSVRLFKSLNINVIVINALDTTKLPQLIDSKSSLTIKTFCDYRLYIQKYNDKLAIKDVMSGNKVEVILGTSNDIRSLTK
jgi:hypothetical protein